MTRCHPEVQAEVTEGTARQAMVAVIAVVAMPSVIAEVEAGTPVALHEGVVTRAAGGWSEIVIACFTIEESAITWELYFLVCRSYSGGDRDFRGKQQPS